VATSERRCENEHDAGVVSDVRRQDPGRTKHTDAGNTKGAEVFLATSLCVFRALCVGVVGWIMGSAVKVG
jgi:hypothetical protein